MRSTLAMFAIVLVVSAGRPHATSAADALPNPHTKFLYAEYFPGQQGMFTALGGGKWRQTDVAGGDLTLTQIQETKEYVELRTDRGDYLARIYKDRYMIKRKEDSQFTTYKKGRWVSQ